jgi:hypothetical protein
MNRVRFAAASLALLAALAGPAHAAAPPAIVPDPTLTPGAVRTTDVGEICSHGTRELRHWDRERDDHIMAEYGLPAGPHPDFEIDHLVPLGIGGADSDANLWPEPRRSVEPRWNAETKDRLEWKLRDLVCSGQLDVVEAQRMIAEDLPSCGKRRAAVIPIAALDEPLDRVAFCPDFFAKVCSFNTHASERRRAITLEEKEPNQSA